jgi:hypothetical protein
MGIKEEADHSHFLAHPEEREIALRLDEGFSITFGQPHGGLSKWLAEPKPHLRERFGFAKELLVIYSKYPRTDARVLTAIENISREPEFRHRIDRAIVLLVHGGEVHETEALLRERLDWIIVPISTGELANPQRGDLFLRSRIARAVGAVDLFAMSSPITDDKYFFGRDEAVQNLIARVVDRRESAGLFGLRKTGKTSVLFAVKRRLSGANVLVEYVDCQNPGIHAARWWQVLETLTTRCVQLLQAEHKRTATVGGDYTEQDAGTRFLNDIRHILAKGALTHVVLLLDEIEYITPSISGALGRHWDDDFLPFWQAIRAVHHEVQGRLTFVVGGVNPSAVTTSHFGQRPNPIFQLAPPTFLAPMDAVRVRDMVRTIGRYSGLKIAEPVYPYLTETYGGHPFLVRLACSSVWNAADVSQPEKRVSIDVNAFEDVSAEIKARLEQPIKDILLSLVWWYPEEYELLRILAEGDADFVREYVEGEPASLLKFANYGLLVPDGSRFAISEVRDFLHRHGATYKSELSPFTRGDMPPQYLPEVPDLAALAKLFEKRTEIESLMRRAILLYLGVKHNWDNTQIAKSMQVGIHRKDAKAAADLFVGRTPQLVINDLYALDLKTIVLANWDVFGVLVGGNKGRFEMNMDTLNRARRIDAHAKPIPPGEIDEIHNSYAWLRARLGAVPQ